MNWTAILGAAVMGVSAAVIINETKAKRMGQLPPEEEEEDDPGVVAGAPSGGGGGGGGGFGPVGVVGGAPSGSMPGGVVQGTPMPVSNPSPAGGFPGVFPTAGPGNSLFFGGGGGGWGGWGGWGWPYGYGNPYGYGYPRNYPQDYECRWKETPPKDDTPLICRAIRPPYPVAWGPPNWGWW